MAALIEPAQLGRYGEDLAASYLTGLGLVVLSRNWRCRDGELDLVATDGRRLIICEVKTRSGTGYGAPAEAVTPTKAERIRRATSAWLRAHRVGWCEVRFDVLSVLCSRAGPGGLARDPAPRSQGPVTVEHLQGVF